MLCQFGRKVNSTRPRDIKHHNSHRRARLIVQSPLSPFPWLVSRPSMNGDHRTQQISTQTRHITRALGKFCWHDESQPQLALVTSRQTQPVLWRLGGWLCVVSVGVAPELCVNTSFAADQKRPAAAALCRGSCVCVWWTFRAVAREPRIPHRQRAVSYTNNGTCVHVCVGQCVNPTSQTSLAIPPVPTTNIIAHCRRRREMRGLFLPTCCRRCSTNAKIRN